MISANTRTRSYWSVYCFLSPFGILSNVCRRIILSTQLLRKKNKQRKPQNDEFLKLQPERFKKTISLRQWHLTNGKGVRKLWIVIHEIFRSTSAFGYFLFDFPFYHRFQRSVRLIVPPLNQHVCFTVCLMHYWKKNLWFMFIIRLSLCIVNTFCWNTSILDLFLDNLSKCSGRYNFTHKIHVSVS